MRESIRIKSKFVSLSLRVPLVSVFIVIQPWGNRLLQISYWLLIGFGIIFDFCLAARALSRLVTHNRCRWINFVWGG